MTPTVPRTMRKQNVGSRTYVQVSEFPEGTFVESTPSSFDSDNAPDGFVFVPVGVTVSIVYCSFFTAQVDTMYPT